jgi:hypothetical protein
MLVYRPRRFMVKMDKFVSLAEAFCLSGGYNQQGSALPYSCTSGNNGIGKEGLLYSSTCREWLNVPSRRHTGHQVCAGHVLNLAV